VPQSATCLGLALVTATCSAQVIEATQVTAKTIRVTVPGRFETDMTTVKGFGHTFFDLAMTRRRSAIWRGAGGGGLL